MVKNPSAMQETWVRSIPGSGRSSGEANGYPLQYSMNSFCLKENYSCDKPSVVCPRENSSERR